MNSEIKIKVLDIDEDDNDFTKFRIFFANEIASASLEFYNYIDCFNDFASKLESFPISAKESITFEVGGDSEKWAYYLVLKINCEPNGNSALYIKLDNHQTDLDLIKSEFFIKTVPASLNKLGQILKSWNPKDKNEITWIAE